MAVIDLDTEEKPHIIFETLNARGEPLLQSDLIKNTVMYEANIVEEPERARALWGMFEDQWWRGETTEGRNVRIHLDRFLNYWITMQTGTDVSANRVAAEFRQYIEDEDIETTTAQVRNTGLSYRELVQGTVAGMESFLSRMRVMELGVVMPVLLWLCTSDTPQKARLRSIRALESYLVRRMLCGMQSQGLNRLFISLVVELKGKDPLIADHTIVEYLARRTSDTQIWPNDEMLRERLELEEMKGTIGRRKMVLEAVELALRDDKAEPLGNTQSLTLEHVMPQKWATHWPLPSDTQDKDQVSSLRDKAVNKLGNLTLVTGKLNSSISNGEWDIKRTALDKHSSLFLNKRLLQAAPNKWNEEGIDERSAKLANVVVAIWPGPHEFGAA